MPDTKPDAYLAIYGRPLGGGATRRRPSPKLAAQMLEQQKNACMYCGLRIGATVMRGHRPVLLRINWDHFIPYAYMAANPLANWVAACHVCNGIKSSRMFSTVVEAQDFIMKRRGELGYERRAVE